MTSQPQLTEQELVALRQLLQDAEHATWLRKKIFIVAPIVFTIVSAVIAAVSWVANHLTFKP